MNHRREVMRERRLAWEQRWRSTQGVEFTWNIDEMPEELQQLIEQDLVDDGPPSTSAVEPAS